MRLKELRERRKLNMRQMAIILDVPYTTYVSWEKGEREPNSEKLVLLSRYFGCTVDYLIGLSDEFNAQYKMPEQKESAPLKVIRSEFENKLSGLSDTDLTELETFIQFLRYRHDHSSDC